MSDIYKTVYAGVIGQAIKDMMGAHSKEKVDAIKYIQSNAFIDHCEIAGYPKGLQDTLDEIMLLSTAEQKYFRKLLNEYLVEC